MSSFSYRGVPLPPGRRIIGPFHPAYSDAVYNIVRAAESRRPAVAQALAKEVLNGMVQRPSYYRDDNPLTRAVVDIWQEELAPALRKVVQGQPQAIDSLRSAWKAYALIQRDIVMAGVRAAFDDAIHANNQPAAGDKERMLTELALADMTAASQESAIRPVDVLRDERPPSEALPVATEWTNEWHAASMERPSFVR